jgi:hypothetical protein
MPSLATQACEHEVPGNSFSPSRTTVHVELNLVAVGTLAVHESLGLGRFRSGTVEIVLPEVEFCRSRFRETLSSAPCGKEEYADEDVLLHEAANCWACHTLK